MTYIRLILTIFIACFLLISCSSKPAEEYVDYFYSKPLPDNSKIFTYILYLGEEGKSITQHQKEHVSISPRSESERNQAPRRRTSNSNKGEESTSLSFRMEEEAYKRLLVMLDKKKFCESEVEFLESQYTWLRYTIKGKCSA